MLYKLVLKLLIAVCVFLVVFLSGNVNCYSQAATKLKSFNMQKIKQGLLINIENSNSPADFTVEESDRPPQLLIEIIGAEVSFKEYENRPIEMPVHEKGITKVVVEERSNYKRIPQESVAIRVELSRLFHYDVDAQFNGKFLTVLIAPYGEDIQGTILDEKGKTLLNPSERLKEIKILKEKEAQKARQRLRDFTQETRVELIRKESKERVSEIREKAQERIESGKTLEESYKKMKAETEISSLPMAMAHIEDKRLYEDITVPTDTRPVLQRMTPSQPVNKLENCINIALNKYLPLQIAKEQGELAKLRVREARRSFYPAFLGEWNEVDGDTVTEPYRGRSYGVQAEQPLFTGGKLMATLRKEQLGEVIAEGNFNRIKHDLMVQISKAYYELVLAKNTLDAMTRLLEVSEKLMGEIEKEFAVFSATPAELLNAQTILNQVNYQIAYS
ncbi:MAG: TolC family protein [Candidatus Omnitrophica bacterium]|nr:TolC family protein [Candidatus Omnitrophota bacterium]